MRLAGEGVATTLLLAAREAQAPILVAVAMIARPLRMPPLGRARAPRRRPIRLPTCLPVGMPRTMPRAMSYATPASQEDWSTACGALKSRQQVALKIVEKKQEKMVTTTQKRW